MSKQKLTPWFPVATPPVRDGVYQVNNGARAEYKSLYEKGVWHGTSSSADTQQVARFGRRFGPTETNIIEWRGLAEKPQ
jgi:hypothetical protein